MGLQVDRALVALCWLAAGSAVAQGAATTLTGKVKVPPRNAPRLDADDKAKKDDPFPRPPESKEAPVVTPWERVQERLSESAPLLAVALLAALALVGTGALMVVAVRKAQAPPPL